ncbi:hypothetical protein GmHk_04G010719 [Glycine max]|nr:hypothetical protein GmHk_04G010719 [Glycine max]
MQSQRLALPPKHEVGPSGPRVSTKESYVDPLGNDPKTGDSDICGLYIEANPSHPIALGRVYEGSTAVHNIPLSHGQVKVGVEDVKDVEALVPVPTDEVTLVGQALNTFLAWLAHLVKLSEQVAVSPAKPPERSNPEVDDPLYLMTLTIPKLFLKPLQVMWDATVFGVFNQDFPLYIKHEDLSKIAHADTGKWSSFCPRKTLLSGFVPCITGQCCFQYICISITQQHNILMFLVFNSALKGLNDTPQPKSKAVARWIVVNYFNDVRPLETERFKALGIQWAQYYLKVRDQS